MNDEMERVWKEAVAACFNALPKPSHFWDMQRSTERNDQHELFRRQKGMKKADNFHIFMLPVVVKYNI
jgi:hypothetical protein